MTGEPKVLDEKVEIVRTVYVQEPRHKWKDSLYIWSILGMMILWAVTFGMLQEAIKGVCP